MIGTTLSHFKITAKLGEGGMGEVYRAEDTKLGREVAIKVLPEAVASDPERLARFEREAKVLAALNHTNIAAIYSLESAEPEPPAASHQPPAGGEGDAPQPYGPTALKPSPVAFLVMELAEGEDLNERIARGPIPLDQALPIASQIADALEAAHEKGIIHRDLKPANVKLTPDGQIKVLDFGLAKALDPRDPTTSGPHDLSLSPTLTAQMTGAGIILGTAAYMSPEQARGQEADRRSDIWSFGLVLYEMLSGNRLFRGETVSDVLAGVLKTDPDWTALPADTPPSIHRLLRRSLTRDPKDRLRDIGDARFDLEEALSEETQNEATRVQTPRTRRRELLAWLVALLAIGTAAFLAFRDTPSQPIPAKTWFDFTLPEDHRLAYVDEPILALSPDGRSLAFVVVDAVSGEQSIHIRTLEETTARPVLGTQGATDPRFSPDGEPLIFFADSQLRRIPIDGGRAIDLTQATNPRGAAWSPDGTIVYSPDYVAGLWRISTSGGTPELLIEPDPESEERTYRWPDVLPDGRTVIFTIGTSRNPNNYDDAKVAAYSFDTNSRTILVENASMGRFVWPDRLAFTSKGVLYVVPIDLDRMQVVGDPSPVLQGLGGDPSSGVAYFDVALNGTLAYVSGAVSDTQAHLTLLNREGESTRLPIEPQSFHHPRFAPDGGQIAFTVGEGATGAAGDVWVYDQTSGAFNRITFGGNDLYPLFTPDGKWLTYLHGVGEIGIYRKPVDGSGVAELISPAGLDTALPDSWSPDGQVLAFTQIATTPDVYLLRPGEEPVLFESNASSPVFSPDGRWIAYASPGSGTSAVFVRPVEGQGKWQVSPTEGGYPRWRSGGRELFYIGINDPGRPLMKVDIEPGEVFRAGPPQQIVDELAYRFATATAPINNWDAVSTGDQFIFVELDRDESERVSIQMVLNWAEQLPGGGS